MLKKILLLSIQVLLLGLAHGVLPVAGQVHSIKPNAQPNIAQNEHVQAKMVKKPKSKTQKKPKPEFNIAQNSQQTDFKKANSTKPEFQTAQVTTVQPNVTQFKQAPLMKNPNSTQKAKPKIVEKPPQWNQNITLPENIRKILFTNATVKKFPLLNTTHAFHKFDESSIAEPKSDKDYKFVNSSMDYINQIKKIAQDEQNIDYENIEEITLRNVVLKDDDPDTKQKVLVRELIVLNTPDDDPDDTTIMVNKAVIVPSISEDHTLERLKQKMYARATLKYNSRIDALMAKLNKLQMGNNSTPEHLKKNKKHLDEAKEAINNLKVPVLKRKHTLTKIEGEMDEFREKVAGHVQDSIKMVNSDEQIRDMASARRHLAKMRSKMKQLKNDLYSDEFEHSDGKDNQIRKQMMALADGMKKLNQKMKKMHRQSEDIERKVKKRHRKIRKMIYDHNKKIEQAIDHDDFTEEDFLSAKQASSKSKQEADLKARGFHISNDWSSQQN